MTEQWAYDPVRRMIRVSAGDLAERGTAYCAGILAHEAGHALNQPLLPVYPARNPGWWLGHSGLTEWAVLQLLNAEGVSLNALVVAFLAEGLGRRDVQPTKNFPPVNFPVIRTAEPAG